MKISQKIYGQLTALADPTYRQFIQKLHPTVAPERILGVRLPMVREIAKEIATGDEWKAYFKEMPRDTCEERSVRGLAIGYLKEDVETVLTLVEEFVPYIDNWGVCDTFCSGLKIAQRHPERVWAFIQPYVMDLRPYYIRFGLVMMIAHFITETYIDDILKLTDQIFHEEYYVKMAQAWLVATCFGKFPKKTMVYMKKSKLDTWTFHKAIQKIKESYRVSAEDKEAVRKLRRK